MLTFGVGGASYQPAALNSTNGILDMSDVKVKFV